ncbi:MAG: hypothetical protein ABIF11_08570 [Nitrospirota bacterium]
MSKKDEKKKDSTDDPSSHFIPTVKKWFFNSIPTIFFKSLIIAIVVILIIAIVISFLYPVIKDFLPLICPSWKVASDKVDSNIEILSANLKLLTLLVTITAIFIGFLSYTTKKDWEKFKEEFEKDWGKFKEEQESVKKETQEKLKEVENRVEDITFVRDLKKKVVDDPSLQESESFEEVKKLQKHFFEEQLHSAWELYAVGRYFERQADYEKALKYYNKAIQELIGNDEDEKDRNPSNQQLTESSKSLKHIYQAKGKVLSEQGDECFKKKDFTAAKEKYESAIESINEAYKISGEKYAYSLYTVGNSLMGIAKVFKEENSIFEKNKKLKEALEKFKEAIGKKDPESKEWFGSFYYNKAAAHALKNEEEDMDEVIKELREASKLGVKGPLSNPGLNPDFDNLKGNIEFEKLCQYWSKDK